MGRRVGYEDAGKKRREKKKAGLARLCLGRPIRVNAAEILSLYRTATSGQNLSDKLIKEKKD